MIAVDTNILARFYCDDPNDAEAAQQRPEVLRLFQNADAIYVTVAVMLEFEWIMRGFYQRTREDFMLVVRHLLGLPNVTVKDWEAVDDALTLHGKGLDFADALHWSRCRHCEHMISFDDRRFSRKLRRLELAASVMTPADFLEQ